MKKELNVIEAELIENETNGETELMSLWRKPKGELIERLRRYTEQIEHLSLQLSLEKDCREKEQKRAKEKIKLQEHEIKIYESRNLAYKSEISTRKSEVNALRDMLSRDEKNSVENKRLKAGIERLENENSFLQNALNKMALPKTKLKLTILKNKERDETLGDLHTLVDLVSKFSNEKRKIHVTIYASKTGSAEDKTEALPLLEVK